MTQKTSIELWLATLSYFLIRAVRAQISLTLLPGDIQTVNMDSVFAVLPGNNSGANYTENGTLRAGCLNYMRAKTFAEIAPENGGFEDCQDGRVVLNSTKDGQILVVLCENTLRMFKRFENGSLEFKMVKQVDGFRVVTHFFDEDDRNIHFIATRIHNRTDLEKEPEEGEDEQNQQKRQDDHGLGGPDDPNHIYFCTYNFLNGSFIQNKVLLPHEFNLDDLPLPSITNPIKKFSYCQKTTSTFPTRNCSTILIFMLRRLISSPDILKTRYDRIILYSEVTNSSTAIRGSFMVDQSGCGELYDRSMIRIHDIAFKEMDLNTGGLSELSLIYSRFQDQYLVYKNCLFTMNPIFTVKSCLMISSLNNRFRWRTNYAGLYYRPNGELEAFNYNRYYKNLYRCALTSTIIPNSPEENNLEDQKPKPKWIADQSITKLYLTNLGSTEYFIKLDLYKDMYYLYFGSYNISTKRMRPRTIVFDIKFYDPTIIKSIFNQITDNFTDLMIPYAADGSKMTNQVFALRNLSYIEYSIADTKYPYISFYGYGVYGPSKEKVRLTQGIQGHQMERYIDIFGMANFEQSTHGSANLSASYNKVLDTELAPALLPFDRRYVEGNNLQFDFKITGPKNSSHNNDKLLIFQDKKLSIDLPDLGRGQYCLIGLNLGIKLTVDDMGNTTANIFTCSGLALFRVYCFKEGIKSISLGINFWLVGAHPLVSLGINQPGLVFVASNSTDSFVCYFVVGEGCVQTLRAPQKTKDGQNLPFIYQERLYLVAIDHKNSSMINIYTKRPMQFPEFAEESGDDYLLSVLTHKDFLVSPRSFKPVSLSTNPQKIFSLYLMTATNSDIRIYKISSMDFYFRNLVLQLPLSSLSLAFMTDLWADPAPGFCPFGSEILVFSTDQALGYITSNDNDQSKRKVDFKELGFATVNHIECVFGSYAAVITGTSQEYPGKGMLTLFDGRNAKDSIRVFHLTQVFSDKDVYTILSYYLPNGVLLMVEYTNKTVEYFAIDFDSPKLYLANTNRSMINKTIQYTIGNSRSAKKTLNISLEVKPFQANIKFEQINQNMDHIPFLGNYSVVGLKNFSGEVFNARVTCGECGISMNTRILEVPYSYLNKTKKAIGLWNNLSIIRGFSSFNNTTIGIGYGSRFNPETGSIAHHLQISRFQNNDELDYVLDQNTTVIDFSADVINEEGEMRGAAILQSEQGIQYCKQYRILPNGTIYTWVYNLLDKVDFAFQTFVTPTLGVAFARQTVLKKATIWIHYVDLEDHNVPLKWIKVTHIHNVFRQTIVRVNSQALLLYTKRQFSTVYFSVVDTNGVYFLSKSFFNPQANLEIRGMHCKSFVNQKDGLERAHCIFYHNGNKLTDAVFFVTQNKSVVLESERFYHLFGQYKVSVWHLPIIDFNEDFMMVKVTDPKDHEAMLIYQRKVNTSTGLFWGIPSYQYCKTPGGRHSKWGTLTNSIPLVFSRKVWVNQKTGQEDVDPKGQNTTKLIRTTEIRITQFGCESPNESPEMNQNEPLFEYLKNNLTRVQEKRIISQVDSKDDTDDARVPPLFRSFQIKNLSIKLSGELSKKDLEEIYIEFNYGMNFIPSTNISLSNLFANPPVPSYVPNEIIGCLGLVIVVYFICKIVTILKKPREYWYIKDSNGSKKEEAPRPRRSLKARSTFHLDTYGYIGHRVATFLKKSDLEDLTELGQSCHEDVGRSMTTAADEIRTRVFSVEDDFSIDEFDDLSELKISKVDL